jgi:hypothetical protein
MGKQTNSAPDQIHILLFFLFPHSIGILMQSREMIKVKSMKQ